MIKVIPTNKLDSLYQKINHCLYLTSDNTVVKNCLRSFNNPGLIQERLEYVSSLPLVKGYTNPINLYSDGNTIYGYEMEYLRGCKTILACINENISIDFDIKKRICLDLLKTLEELNKYYYVGDINLNNIMIGDNGSGYIIDWENGTPKDFNYGILSEYVVEDISSIQFQDAFKMFISTVSLLYGINFELLFPYMSPSEMHDYAKKIKLDSSIIAYLEDVSSQVLSGSNETIYFSEYLSHIRGISKYRVGSVKKKMLKNACIDK